MACNYADGCQRSPMRHAVSARPRPAPTRRRDSARWHANAEFIDAGQYSAYRDSNEPLGRGMSRCAHRNIAFTPLEAEGDSRAESRKRVPHQRAGHATASVRLPARSLTDTDTRLVQLRTQSARLRSRVAASSPPLLARERWEENSSTKERMAE